jgi:hypothetical protein
LKNKYILDFYENYCTESDSKNTLKISLDDLESYGDYEEHSEFSLISNTIVGNKTVSEWFSYDEKNSMWWFIYPTIYPKFNEAALFIDRFLNFLEQNPTQIIQLHGNFEKLSIIEKICSQKNIKLKINQKNYLKYQISKIIKNTSKSYFYNRITNKKSRMRLKNIDTDLLKHKSPSVIITSPGIYRRSIYDYKSKQAKQQEFVLQPFLDFLDEKNISTLCFDLDYTFHGETKILNERIKSKYNWIPVDVFLLKPKNNETHKKINSIKQNYNKFQEFPLSTIFQYKKIPLWNFLESTFSEVFLEPYIPTYLHLISEIEKYFQKHKPSCIIQIYETGPYAKSFEIASKKYEVTSIGLQHGIIYGVNPDYLQESKNKILKHSIPDFTYVFGDYYKSILTNQCNFPENQIKVMGNPNFYEIDKIKSSIDSNYIAKLYGFKTKKIILVPLSFRLSNQMHNNPDDVLLRQLFKSFEQSNDTTLLIRPHPGDKFDTSSIIKQKFKVKNFTVSNLSLFEDIMVSDIVVTTISAVSVDATIFEKPVLFVDISGASEQSLGGIRQYMIKNKVAISVSLTDLFKTISSINKNELWNSKDFPERQNFQKSYHNYGEKIDLLNLIHLNSKNNTVEEL